MAETHVLSSKSDVAYAELRRQILSGDLAPGSRLAQYELATSLNMSITPLREAIRKLSSENLVDLDTHRNVYVARIGATEARKLFEVRLLLDPPAVELAAARRTADDIAAMEAAMQRLLPVTREGGEAALVAHRELHRTIYRASHNDVLIRLLDDLWDKSDRYRRLGLHVARDDESRTRDFDEHRLLVDLVAGGEGAKAALLTHVHITNSVTPAAIALLDEHEHAKPRGHRVC
jgi:DNA-binding GntR family transcriptional regulator